MAHAGGGVIVEVGRGCSGDNLGQAVAVIVGVSGGCGTGKGEEIAVGVHGDFGGFSTFYISFRTCRVTNSLVHTGWIC